MSNTEDSFRIGDDDDTVCRLFILVNYEFEESPCIEDRMRSFANVDIPNAIEATLPVYCRLSEYDWDVTEQEDGFAWCKVRYELVDEQGRPIQDLFFGDLYELVPVLMGKKNGGVQVNFDKVKGLRGAKLITAPR